MDDFIRHTKELSIATIPALIGISVMAFCANRVTRTPSTNRPLLTFGLIVGALGIWATSAMLLAVTMRFAPILDVAAVTAFFTGVAFLFPVPAGAAQTKVEHGLAAKIVMISGLILGLSHSLAFMFTMWWPARVLEIYAALGIH